MWIQSANITFHVFVFADFLKSMWMRQKLYLGRQRLFLLSTQSEDSLSSVLSSEDKDTETEDKSTWTELTDASDVW